MCESGGKSDMTENALVIQRQVRVSTASQMEGPNFIVEATGAKGMHYRWARMVASRVPGPYWQTELIFGVLQKSPVWLEFLWKIKT